MKETNFYCFYGDQFVNADIAISSWEPKINPATGKLEIDDATVKFAKFENWVYVTSNEYEIEYLNAYNKWWVLSNGKRLKPTPFPTISTSNPQSRWEVIVERVVEKEITKKVIPESFINMLDIEAILDLAKNDFDYVTETTDRKKLIKELKEQWIIV